MMNEEENEELYSQEGDELFGDVSIEHVSLVKDKTDIEKLIDSKTASVQQTNNYPFDMTGQDLVAANENANLPVSAITSENKDVQELISSALDQYNKKFGTELTYQTIRDYLLAAVSDDPERQKIRGIVNSDIISRICEYSISKSITVAARTLDIMLDNLQRKKYQQDITDEVLLMLDRVFTYVDKFESIRDKYKIYDVQSSIDVIKSDSDRKYDSSKEETEKLSNTLLSVLSSSLDPRNKSKPVEEGQENKEETKTE